MTKRRMALFIAVLSAVSALGALMAPSSASAYSYRESLVRKGMYEGVLECSAQKLLANQPALPMELNREYIEKGGLLQVVPNKVNYPLPTNKTDKASDPFPYTGADEQTCLGILFGLDSSSLYSRVLGINPKTKTNDPKFVKEYMGYNKETNGADDGGESCVTFKVTMRWKRQGGNALTTVGTAKTRKFCLELSGGKVKNLRLDRVGSFQGIEEEYTPSGSYEQVRAENGSLKLPNTDDVDKQGTSHSVVGMTKDEAKKKLKEWMQSWFNGMINNIYQQNESVGGKGTVVCISEANGGSSGFLAHYDYCEYHAENFKNHNIEITAATPTEGEKFMSYRIVANTLAVADTEENTTTLGSTLTRTDQWAIIKKLTNTSTENQAYAETYLTYSEKIMLYQYYLLGTYGLEVSCASKPEEGDGIKFFNEGQTKPDVNCSVIGLDADNRTQQSKKVNSVVAASPLNSVRYFAFSSKKIGVSDVIAFLKEIPENTVLTYPSDISSTYYNTDVTDADAVAEAEESKKKKNNDVSCYDTAGSSNWIACPIIDNSSIATKTLYKYIENMIQVNTELFTTGKSTSGTFSAWESFRNIANIVFIIVFIIVILSQITGFGVDNYGIKKILPKLILGALLVNISFYVCQACIDVANITGGGIKGLLQSAANNIKGSKELQFQFDKMNAVKIGTQISVAAIAAAIVAAAIYVSGGAVLVPLLLCAVGVAIGVLFFLILLAVRQGLAVILVVISPMAFVAYMLPNTKSLFSKWLKLFSGTLLAYPICSLVLYGGELTSKIMLVAASNPSSGIITNFGLSVTSAILSIAPVFFIPTLITKSMAGISAISGRLQNSLSTMAKGATQRSGISQGIEENAKGVKYKRAKAWISENRNKKMGAYGRARMRNRMGAVDTYERESAKMYETQAAGLSLEGLKDMALKSFDKKGNLDAEKFNAAFESAYTKDPDGAWKLFQAISETSDYKNLKQKDQVGFAKMNNSLARNGGVIGKAILKENNSSGTTSLQSLDSLFSSGKIASRIHDMGEDVISNMDKDDFNLINSMGGANLDGYFTDTQLQRGMAASMSGSDKKAFINVVQKLSKQKAQDVLKNMTVNEWATTDSEKLHTLYDQAYGRGEGGTISGVGSFSSYEDYNIKRAIELKRNGDSDVINNLRPDQQTAWNNTFRRGV